MVTLVQNRNIVKLKNYFQMIFTSSLWGSSFLLMKFALDELDPFQIAFYRILIGMLFINLLPIKKVNFPIEKHLTLALVGLLWMSLPFYLFAKAEETITSSLAGLINGTTPIFISLFGVLFFKQLVSKLQKFYLFTGFIGIYLVSFELDNFIMDIGLGTELALLASISYGLAANTVQPLIKKFGSLSTLKIALRYATLFSVILLLLNSEFKNPTLEISLLPMLLLGIGSSGLAFLSFYKLIDDVGAIIGSMTVYIIPIFASIFGYLFLNEITGIVQLLGMLIVIISAFQFSKKRN